MVRLAWFLSLPFRRIMGWKPIRGQFKMPARCYLLAPQKAIRLTEGDSWPSGFYAEAARNSGYLEYRES